MGGKYEIIGALQYQNITQTFNRVKRNLPTLHQLVILKVLA